MLLPPDKRKTVIDIDDVEDIIAKMARIPAKTVSHDDRETLRNLDRDLKAMVYGQDKAIDALVAAIKLARAGLREPEKPIGCYLSRAPRASARPKWHDNWRSRSASNSSASICRNIWNGTAFRA